LRQEIKDVIRSICQGNGIEVDDTPADENNFDDGYLAAIALDRRLGGLIYDATKQVGAFHRLISLRRNQELFSQLRPGSLPGLAHGGSGIRIDNPGETKYQTAWHQEYPTQFRSLDGIVFWTPLRTIDEAIGPLTVAESSHRLGIVPVVHDAGTAEQSGAYAIRLADESIADQFQHHQLLCKPGDLAVMDFLTLHRSGSNVSDRSRWSVQTRWFNFLDPSGQRHGWAGPETADLNLINDIHPAMFADRS
jgi:hypothetical protein